MGQYFHIFANGDDARDFITSVEDFVAAFNRVAICAAMFPELLILAFSIEESHPHFLAFGSYEDCIAFKSAYEQLTYCYITATRGSRDGVVFELEMLVVDNEDYLLSVAAYVLVQPTKDGKQVLPGDYRWGTASMYFRPEGFPSIWRYGEDWQLCPSVKFGDLTYKEKRALLHSSMRIPSHWLVCNGLVLPSNYVAVRSFEDIFQTFNRFRVYSSASKKHLQPVVDRMAKTRGVNIPDVEARVLARAVSERMYGKKDSRWLSPIQRLELAKALRSEHGLSLRQIATLSRLPESEVRKYIR